MAEHSFQEVMHQFDRMCWYYQRNGTCPMDCPIVGLNISQCRKVVFEGPVAAEKIIMSWAAKHPEPVYPTFGEWLEKQGIIKLINGDRYEEDGRKVYILLESVENQIPADIAEKLGIEPKED